MMDVLLTVVTVAAVLSVPVLYLLEYRCGRGRWITAIRIALAAAGAASIIAVEKIFEAKVSSAPAGVAEWATDFLRGYSGAVLEAEIVLLGILVIAAVIGHRMRKVRVALTVILPAALALATIFAAMLAGDGQFAVDVYIRWMAPGFALLVNLVPLAERGNSPKQR